MSRVPAAPDPIPDDVRALAAKPRVAVDHVSARPGEIMAVDAHGRHLTAARLRRGYLVAGALGASFVGAAMLAGAAIGGPPGFVLMVGIPVGALLGTRRVVRYVRVVKQVNALVFAGRRDEALAALARMPRARGGFLEAQRRGLQAAIALMFGDHAACIADGERALTLADGPRHAVFRDAGRMTVACAYAASGDVDGARRHRRAIERTHDHPVMRLHLAGTDLLIAFTANAVDELPDDDALHELARIALEFHHSAFALVGLAWAFTRRGDADMAAHLLANVADRSDAWYLADSYPALAAWRAAHDAAEG